MALTTAALLVALTGCFGESVHYAKVTDGDRSKTDGTSASSRGGGRGGAGELLFPMPDEQEAVVAIQDAGLPADVVGYGGMRFVETTAAGAAKLSGRAGLESINISLKDVSNDELAHLAQLPAVNGLLIWSPKVTDVGLAHLAGLSGLKYLWLEQTEVTAAGLEHLASLTNLRSLNIRFKTLTGGLGHLAGMSQLTALNIPGSKITDDDLAQLTGLSSLESLNIGGSPITDAGLQHIAALKNLKTLHLRQTGITDAGLAQLAPLEHLQELNLLLCAGVTDAGVKALQAALPDCTIRK
ncbi:MAG: leucine-rich repeat domain-containing protein [Planctomycetaceae bacterium]